MSDSRQKRIWAPLLHLYQPPGWKPATIRRVARESYRPVLRILLARPEARITLNLTGALTEQLQSLGMSDILDMIRTLAERRQVEFTHTAKYHVILPLLPAHEQRRQVELNMKANRSIIGPAYQPSGFFPPELCYSTSVADIATDCGAKYVVLDEIAHDGHLGSVRFDTRYRHNGIQFVFRHRGLSDLFFTSQLPDAESFLRALDSDTRSATAFVTAMDGELLGHHNPGMERVFASILDAGALDVVTYSEYLHRMQRERKIDPIPASWSSRERDIADGAPYALWQHPENPIHHKQWELIKIVVDEVRENTSDPNAASARSLLDESLNSDPQWWASASPWWDVEIIANGAARLVQVLNTFQQPTPARHKRAKTLAREIAALARQWQDSGKAAAIRERFLRGEASDRLFAGDTVTTQEK